MAHNWQFFYAIMKLLKKIRQLSDSITNCTWSFLFCWEVKYLGEKTGSVWNMVGTIIVSVGLVAALSAAFVVFGDKITDVFNTTLDNTLSLAKNVGK